MGTTALPPRGPVRRDGRRHLSVMVLAVLAAALLLLPGSAAVAAAPPDGGLDEAGQALRDGPVYVDPRAEEQLPERQADAVADTIERADAPVFVAVLPESSDYEPATLFQDLRAEVGLNGVYAVALGDRFDARADSSVLSRDAVSELADQAHRSADGEVPETLATFVDQATDQAAGNAPASWEGVRGAERIGPGGATVLVGLVVMLGFITSAALLSGGAQRRRAARQDREQLASLRPVVDEDITAFGAELERVDIAPANSTMDDAMREDYARALDAYERAKSAMAAARQPREVRQVTEALEDGRFALATLDARRRGEALPERRPPCFFDPRHGPSVQDVSWSPPAGTERSVPVCAADAARLGEGEEPMAREVDTPSGRRPYWEAGPTYGPWAYGYFGGGMLPGLLMGTMLGSTLGTPHAYGEHGGFDGGGGAEGGDFGGDFGGGFGGFGGGDFGGGF